MMRVRVVLDDELCDNIRYSTNHPRKRIILVPNSVKRVEEVKDRALSVFGISHVENIDICIGSYLLDPRESIAILRDNEKISLRLSYGMTSIASHPPSRVETLFIEDMSLDNTQTTLSSSSSDTQSTNHVSQYQPKRQTSNASQYINSASKNSHVYENKETNSSTDVLSVWKHFNSIQTSAKSSTSTHISDTDPSSAQRSIDISSSEQPTKRRSRRKKKKKSVPSSVAHDGASDDRNQSMNADHDFVEGDISQGGNECNAVFESGFDISDLMDELERKRAEIMHSQHNV